jgi:hypothetical protein
VKKDSAVKPFTDEEMESKFGPSPYPSALALREERRRRREAKAKELAARRKMSNPQHFAHAPDRVNHFQLDEAKVAEMEALGLYVSWVREDEVAEYEAKGYAVATRDQVGRRVASTQADTAGHSSAVQAREMVCMIAPKDWHNQRMELVGAAARRQVSDDPDAAILDESLKRVPGQFGKGARRRRPGDDDE